MFVWLVDSYRGHCVHWSFWLEDQLQKMSRRWQCVVGALLLTRSTQGRQVGYIARREGRQRAGWEMCRYQLLSAPSLCPGLLGGEFGVLQRNNGSWCPPGQFLPSLSSVCGAACMAMVRASEENSSPEVVTATPNVASTPHTSELSRAFARCFHTRNPTSLSPSVPHGKA